MPNKLETRNKIKLLNVTKHSFMSYMKKFNFWLVFGAWCTVYGASISLLSKFEFRVDTFCWIINGLSRNWRIKGRKRKETLLCAVSNITCVEMMRDIGNEHTMRCGTQIKIIQLHGFYAIFRFLVPSALRYSLAFVIYSKRVKNNLIVAYEHLLLKLFSSFHQ